MAVMVMEDMLGTSEENLSYKFKDIALYLLQLQV